jgi:hypothetical protein
VCVCACVCARVRGGGDARRWAVPWSARGFKLRILIGAPSVAIQLDYANLLATAVVALAQK